MTLTMVCKKCGFLSWADIEICPKCEDLRCNYGGVIDDRKKDRVMENEQHYVVKRYPEKEGVVSAETFFGPFKKETDAIRFMKLGGFLPPEFHIEQRGKS